jgi:glycosyltransferase EpsD
MNMVEKRVLFCATVDYHFKAFHLPYMKWFKEQGWEVHVAACGDMTLPYVDQKFNLPISRSPVSAANIRAYKELKDIIETNQYKIIHCHTPVGGALARLAARKVRKNGTSVIYTAHGFHFCQGAPVQNWLIYYPIESWLARFTDCLITINEEDYKRAVQHKFKAGKIEQVHGVGVDVHRFKPPEKEYKEELRIAYGYNVGDFLLFYAAEFNKNKNQQLLIQALALIKDEVPNAKLLLAGEGTTIEECKRLAVSLGLRDRVQFLGFRKDVEELLHISDVAVASSYREGLPVNVMEAMAIGLPIIASSNRGHKELVINNKNGYIVSPENPFEFSTKILELMNSVSVREKMRNSNLERVKQFSVEHVGQELSSLYSFYMMEDADETENQHNRAYI